MVYGGRFCSVQIPQTAYDTGEGESVGTGACPDLGRTSLGDPNSNMLTDRRASVVETVHRAACVERNWLTRGINADTR